jgi:hypothetical protein
MIDQTPCRVFRLPETNRREIAACAVACVMSLLVFATPTHAANGDCSQPQSAGDGPAASDCLVILKTAVGSASCDPECICAPKGSFPISASDALLCLRFAVGHPVELNCPCDGTTTTTTTTVVNVTTTLGSGVVGAVPLQGRMNAGLELGLPAASAACDAEYPGSDYCEYSELLAAEGSGLAGLEDSNGDPVTSLWAIDPAQSVGRQCGDNLSSSAPRWTYATAHIGVGGDVVSLDNGTGMLGTVVVGGGTNRNCNELKSVACCQ